MYGFSSKRCATSCRSRSHPASGSEDKFQLPVVWIAAALPRWSDRTPGCQTGTYVVEMPETVGSFSESFPRCQPEGDPAIRDKALVNAEQAALNIQVNYLAVAAHLSCRSNCAGRSRLSCELRDYEDFTSPTAASNSAYRRIRASLELRRIRNDRSG